MREAPGIKTLAAWLFWRLPFAFTVPFLVLSVVWLLWGFKAVDDIILIPLLKFLSRIQSDIASVDTVLTGVVPVVYALLVILCFMFGFVVAYNIAAGCNWLAFIWGWKPIGYKSGDPQIPGPKKRTGRSDPLAKVERIGIVLAGGGAKGAYQAGAMKAIYRYLYDHDALGKVKVISSTSIGSWNALFWLADLIKPEGGWRDQSTHEKWWRSISAKSLAAPSWYLPGLRNAFLSAAPWRRVFDHLFKRDKVVQNLCNTDIHFYFTRSNVRSGELACVTNNPKPTPINRVSYERLNPRATDTYIAGIKEGVFASMDLPPLFPYTKIQNDLFEDGGVIDNLPIEFPASEGCDLIFILPLNSNFEEQPNERSIIARLLRVMEVRQGALERSGFKLLYLYNEIASLRSNVSSGTRVKVSRSGQSLLGFALQRQNRMTDVFAICPQKSFVRETIDTQELWKAKDAGVAFDVMRKTTSNLLPKFKFNPQKKTRIALVSRAGSVTWDEHF